ncbi:type I restriction enzyme HsdR N-terminal domain-containing protein [Desulfogranum mediterraneum]|uniref:type I restriction enzyme HsdR N-terminal domain-containing protein n=1 Tax=Desulfogranum mediterraneum TaxID=160661 RepID=UPI0004100BA0|nr:type I restriction enzyme HsdR N-terminal domain-containing protein [Desulfogranum mediterraneum]
MIDTSGHHLVYGVLHDYLSGEELVDTDDERIRQDLARMLVEDLGYERSALEPRLKIISDFNGKQVESLVELAVRVKGRRLFILRYGPGSLVTREQAAIAAARILEPDYRIPLAVVTNGRDAELLDTRTGKVLGTGMASIPDRLQAETLCQEYPFEPYLDGKQRERALRILNVFDEEICCADSKCKHNGTNNE